MTGPLRLGVVTVGLVLAATLVVGIPTAISAAAASDRIAAAGGRATGTVVGIVPGGVVVHWTPAGEPGRDTVVALATDPPPAGVATEVAYPPGNPAAAIIPGATVLADADRAVSVLAMLGSVLVVVLGVSAVVVVRRRRARRRPSTSLRVRRIRVESGPLARSWLEVPGGWIPVHYDPVLTSLPSPVMVSVYGEPRRHRLVPVVVDGRTVWPSGAVSLTEPRGRRHDNPIAPDGYADSRGATLDRLGRRMRALLPLAAPAPVVAVLWVWVVGGGVVTWLGTTLVLAALALWWGAVRGLDPT